MIEKIKKKQRKFSDDDLDYSMHALERLEKRCLSKSEITRTLSHGKRVHHGSKILVTYKGLRVVLSNDSGCIITAYKKEK